MSSFIGKSMGLFLQEAKRSWLHDYEIRISPLARLALGQIAGQALPRMSSLAILSTSELMGNESWVERKDFLAVVRKKRSLMTAAEAVTAFIASADTFGDEILHVLMEPLKTPVRYVTDDYEWAVRNEPLVFTFMAGRGRFKGVRWLDAHITLANYTYREKDLFIAHIPT